MKISKEIPAALVCYSFWGLSFMASRTALNMAPVFLLLSHRFLLARLVMTALRFAGFERGCFRGKPLLPLVMLGLFQPVLYFFGEQYGILHAGTVFSGVMIALIPIAAALTAIPVLGEKITLRQFFYSVISVAGVIGIGLMTKNSGSLDWIGVAGLAFAVFSAVAYLLLSRRISGIYSPFERSYSMVCAGAFVFTVLAVLTVKGSAAAYFRPLFELSYVRSVAFLGVCCSCISFFLSNYVITGLSVAQTSIFSNLSTAISVFAGVVFLHEPFTLAGFVCCVMILAGIYGVNAGGTQLRKE